MTLPLRPNLLIVASVILLLALTAYFYHTTKGGNKELSLISTPQTGRVWQVKSIDTMKYSRDRAREHFTGTAYQVLVDEQIQQVKNTNANYVAVATPYDDEFIPVIKLWTASARNHGLSVWFRGNFSAWEGWFGYPKNLTREDHLKKAVQFVQNNPDLFENGDVFTACTECENGGPGDPRYNTTPEEFRKFMIDEKNALDIEFKKINKNVKTNFNSMNLDVAILIYDQPTLSAMGNLIAVDHYTKNSSDEVEHIISLQSQTGAQIMLGEIGAPISAIHGSMNMEEQAHWAEESLKGLSQNQAVVGINWWVNKGGETSLIADNNALKPAYSVVKKYFSLTSL